MKLELSDCAAAVGFRADGQCRQQRGFSLLELLLVAAIIAIATAVVMPRFSVAMSGGQLHVAARSLARTARYARTMALLNQTEVELILQTGRIGPEIRVAAAGWQPPSDASTEAQALDPAPETLTAPEQTNQSDDAAVHSVDSVRGDDIRLVRTLDGVMLTFMGFADRPGESPAGDKTAEMDNRARIVFQANGICRPFRVRVSDASGAWHEVEVDVVGQARIRSPQS